MRQEVFAAADFLCRTILQEERLSARLQEVLAEQYQGHWYPDEPHRGCAYRSLQLCPSFLDSALLEAAELAGVNNITSKVPAGEDILLWVNPGEVKALRGNKSIQYIWTDGNTTENPYSKLRLKIEPTKSHARMDNGDQPTGSPSAPAAAGSRTPPKSFAGSAGGSPQVPAAAPFAGAPMVPLPPQAMSMACGAAGMGSVPGQQQQQQPPPHGQVPHFVSARG